ncbi:MAG: non-homologous end-joining DNA ligase [Gammaproteobacteria bacterium]|jgi:bifunctional non-homologous end joining protein LigD
MPRLDFGPYSFETSNEDKVLFPEAGITKGQLIDYYRNIAPVLLPHVEDRPLTLHRFPDGIRADGFYQHDTPDYFPDWIARHEAPRAGDGKNGPVDHMLCNNEATLAYLANQAAITLHAWLATAPKLKHPDKLVFDLDPPGDDFEPVRQGARWVVELMQEVGLSPFVMTTGSRGLHVVAPLKPDLDFDAVRDFARAMADWLAEQHPDELTVEQRKNKRRGRLYLDVMRNAYGQTSVAPYAVRALEGAPVATPITLDELGDKHLAPRRWGLQNIRRRLGQRDDPWRDFRRHAASVRRAREKLERL